MNRKKIEEVLELMERYNLTEIDYEEEGVRIHLKKGGAFAAVPVIHNAVPQPVQVPKAPEEKAERPAQEGKKTFEVKAPMVGTFYRAPAPDADPYVDIGQVIKEGDVLCIIEAMKLMNEIKSEVKGKIVDIVIENGQPVEFGQAMFIMEPA